MSAFVEGVLLLLQQGLFCFLFKTTGFFINTGEIESEIDEKQKARNDRFNEQVRGGGGVEGLDGVAAFALPFDSRFNCPLLTFHCPLTALSLAFAAFQLLSLTFHCLSLPSQCLSTASPLAFHCHRPFTELSPTSNCLSTPSTILHHQERAKGGGKSGGKAKRQAKAKAGKAKAVGVGKAAKAGSKSPVKKKRLQPQQISQNVRH